MKTQPWWVPGGGYGSPAWKRVREEPRGTALNPTLRQRIRHDAHLRWNKSRLNKKHDPWISDCICCCTCMED